MAIFGIGAYYHDRGGDVSGDFLEKGCACVGWPEADAPPAHAILRHLRAGDIVFIKAFTPKSGLTIKAIGLVKKGRVRPFGDLGDGVPVRWVWNGKERVGKLDDKWPVRSVTIYEEYHPKVQTRVMDLLLARLLQKGKKTA